MIADTKLTFARIVKGGVAENYLFAHMAEPMRRGERTSDFLAFFGFGSGNYNGHIVGKELEGNIMLLFPVEDNYTRDTSLLQHLFDTLGHEFYIEPADIQKGYLFLAAAHGKHYTKNLSLIESIGVDTKQHIHPMFAYGAHQDGSRFFGVGLHSALAEHEYIRSFIKHFHIKAYPIQDFPYFDWGTWTGLANSQHARGVYGAMRNLHFMASSHEEQNNIIAKIEAETLRIIDVG